MSTASIPAGSNSRRHVDRVLVPRRRAMRDPIRFGSGIDFGSSGTALAEIRDERGHPVKMLVWFSGCMVPAAGVRGFGHRYVPAHLGIYWNQGFDSDTLHEGGRLSRHLLRNHAGIIDRHFGPGTTEQLDLRRTLVISDG